MRHPALPEKMTTEQLGQWITENKIEQKIHVEETPLSDEKIHEYEKKISLVTAKLIELDALKKSFIKTLKKGTPFLKDEFQPADFQIPPTKGTEALEENRRSYSSILKQGFEEVATEIYGIPYGRKKTVVYFDSEGKEYSGHEEAMTKEQEKAYVGLFD